MKAKIIQTLIICAVLVAAFLAFYLQKPSPAPSEKSLPQTDVIKVSEPSETPTFILPIDTAKASHFGILGEGTEDDEEDQSNTEVLSQLFQELKARNVQAVFFSGNIIKRMEKGIDGPPKPMEDEKLNEDLQQFSKLYHGVFGDDAPFYPALGDREIVISNSAKKFIDEFRLHGAKIQGDELLYTVSAGHAFFAVISTDELHDGHSKSGETFKDSMLEWLNGVLKEGALTHKYLFVVGYEPAYPTTSTFSKERLPQRDAFWKILVDNKVLAYFSSKEHLFDRSNRFGVWQIISGGGGVPLNQAEGSRPFYHALVLTIPGDHEQSEKEKKLKVPVVPVPKVQVIDSSGNVIEEFTLSQDNQALYQMRISKNI